MYPPPQRRRGKRSTNINPMLERRLEQMEALLQTTKGQDQNGQFQDATSYREIQSPLSPDFHRSTQPMEGFPAQEHSSYRSPCGVPIIHGQNDKLGRPDSERNLPMASVETPRSILCTPPSSTTRPSVGPFTAIHSNSDDPLTPAPSRLAIDKEESILSPDNVFISQIHIDMTNTVCR